MIHCWLSRASHLMGALLNLRFLRTTDCNDMPLIGTSIYNMWGMHQSQWMLKLEKCGCLILSYPSISHKCVMMCLYAKEPMARLLWDPGDWLWSYSLGEHIIMVPFFQYLVKLGRSLLMSLSVTIPIAQKH